MMSSQTVQDHEKDGSGAEVPEVVPAAAPGDTWRQELAEELIARARTEGVQLAGPGGLLTGITKMVLETALETELADHLG